MEASVRFDADLVRRYDRPGPRYTSYPTAVQFSDRFGLDEYRAAALASNQEPTPKPLSLYVHIPFCSSPCFYCGCTKVITRSREQAENYLTRLYREIELQAELFDRERVVDQLHFGGGTPTFLNETQFRAVMEGLSRYFGLHRGHNREYSIEIDPRSVDEGTLPMLAELGFNRLSLGIQSFQEDELRLLGRVHSAAEAREAYRGARRAGFDNVNLDLIYGLPGQPLAAWQRTLSEAIALRPEHLSLYALTLEEGTPLADDVARGRLPAPDPDLAADMYLWAEDTLATAGYQQYEISNWAFPDRQCRHNLAYWLNEPYLGLGAGAHSCFGGFRFANVKDPHRYVSLVEESAQGDGRAAEGLAPFLAGLRHIASAEQVTAARVMAETVVLGLRLVEGLRLEEFRRRFGQELISVYGAQVQELEALGLLERANGCLRLTASARLLGNEAFQRFLPD